MDEVRIQLRREDRVDCRYAAGSRKGVSSKEEWCEQWRGNGTQWDSMEH